MREIKLHGMRGDGKYSLVDDDIAERPYVTENRWTLDRSGYVVMSSGNYLLHRVVLQPGKGQVVDHINHDKLDNRRINLRICTSKENLRNRVVHKNNMSGIKGVRAHGRKFLARISADGTNHYLGLFPTREEAAAAYDVAAKELFGEFAHLNVAPKLASFTGLDYLRKSTDSSSVPLKVESKEAISAIAALISKR
jgi:hypothetical protein